MQHQNFIYDIETYPNVFTIVIVHYETGQMWAFEYSNRVNQLADFLQMCRYMMSVPNARMVGFNNEAFDYPVIHFILEHGTNITPLDIYNKAIEIINTPFNQRFRNIIWENQRYIPQLDLYKIHHFDNHAKATSLKMLEFQMRRQTIEDLPYAPGTILEWSEIDVLISYNGKDTTDTKAFFEESQPQIKLRDELSVKYGQNMTNFNDTKIGKQYFISRLEAAAPGCCFFTPPGSKRKQPRQTPRPTINLGEVILPYVHFERPEFQRVVDWFHRTTITETKGAIDDLNATVDGFKYDFGTGGIHGSIPPALVESDASHVIVDIDVASYYPNIAIANRVFPEHLGELFCDIYQDVYNERKKHAKGTPENMMFKLALNGTYGDSNNKYSPFYDPEYTMTITINGQLLLCMLAEQVIKIPQLQMIQINTDGLTVRLPRQHVDILMSLCRWWENLTGLVLENVEYSRMWIRDVNNYIAEDAEKGKLKLKGAYVHEGRGWHQNQSGLVIQKAVEAHLVHGQDVEEFITNHEDPFDFCLRTKLNRSSRLVWGEDDQPLQRITRYFISKSGAALTKIMPPTPAQVTKATSNGVTAPDRRMAIQKGWKCTPCNDMSDFNRDDLDFSYYIEKARELIDPIIC